MFLSGRGKATWLEVSLLDIRSYLAQLHREEKGETELLPDAFSSLRSFYRYLMRVRPLRTAESLLPRSRPQNSKKTACFFLEEFEMNHLLELPDLPTELGQRDRALLEFLYSTGCRVSDLVGLTLTRLDLSNRYALLLGKGHRERIVPLRSSLY